jgi:hypothetical protein
VTRLGYRERRSVSRGNGATRRPYQMSAHFSGPAGRRESEPERARGWGEGGKERSGGRRGHQKGDFRGWALTYFTRRYFPTWLLTRRRHIPPYLGSEGSKGPDYLSRVIFKAALHISDDSLEKIEACSPVNQLDQQLNNIV